MALPKADDRALPIAGLAAAPLVEKLFSRQRLANHTWWLWRFLQARSWTRQFGRRYQWWRAIRLRWLQWKRAGESNAAPAQFRALTDQSLVPELRASTTAGDLALFIRHATTAVGDSFDKLPSSHVSLLGGGTALAETVASRVGAMTWKPVSAPATHVTVPAYGASSSPTTSRIWTDQTAGNAWPRRQVATVELGRGRPSSPKLEAIFSAPQRQPSTLPHVQSHARNAAARDVGARLSGPASAPRPHTNPPGDLPTDRADRSGDGGSLLTPYCHIPPSLTRAGLQWLEASVRLSRIHTDVAADRIARGLGADAVTIGREIFFRAGRFDTQTPRGLALLAHELTHVAQQEHSGPLGEAQDGRYRAALEHEASDVERIVYRVLSGGERHTFGHRKPVPTPSSGAPVATAPPRVHLAFASPSSPHVGSPTPTSDTRATGSLVLRAEEGREPAPSGGASQPLDTAALAGQVYRMLERRLRIDKERLGIGRS
jgi:hypothetical protein